MNVQTEKNSLYAVSSALSISSAKLSRQLMFSSGVPLFHGFFSPIYGESGVKYWFWISELPMTSRISAGSPPISWVRYHCW